MKFFIIALIAMIFITIATIKDTKSKSYLRIAEDYQRQLSQNIYTIQNEILGAHNLLKGNNFTVYGAVIMSGDPRVHLSPHEKLKSSHNNVLKKTQNLSSSESNSSIPHTSGPIDLLTARANHVKYLEQILPFPLTRWPSVYTKPCPQFSHGHRTERGVALAHYQIWLDFIFFDQDVLEAMTRPTPEFLSGSPFSSISGRFEARPDGQLFKNGLRFHDSDVLVVLEDDADSAVPEGDLNATLSEELSDMGQAGTDLLFLGWCEGRLARPVPLCAHAYAVTRRGARKLVK
jgi:hypothetical protein